MPSEFHGESERHGEQRYEFPEIDLESISKVTQEHRKAAARLEGRFKDVGPAVFSTSATIATSEGPEAADAADAFDLTAAKIIDLKAKEDKGPAICRVLAEGTAKLFLAGNDAVVPGGGYVAVKGIGYCTERYARSVSSRTAPSTNTEIRTTTAEGVHLANCALWADQDRLAECPSFHSLLEKYSVGQLETKLDGVLGLGTPSPASLDEPETDPIRAHHEWILENFNFIDVKAMDRELRGLTEDRRVKRAIDITVNQDPNKPA